LALVIPAFSMELIAQDEVIFNSVNVPVAQRDLAISQAAALGVTHIRHMLLAHLTHPCLGTQSEAYISGLDEMIEVASTHGIGVQLVLTGVAASWGIPDCPAPNNVALGINPQITAWYKPWVADMVTHFAGLGVKRFSLWNEPNLASFLCASSVISSSDVDDSKCNAPMKQNAKLYHNLYTAGFSVINGLIASGAIPDDVEIIFGEFASADISFMNAVLKFGKITADYASYHPYQYCTPPNSKTSVSPVKSCKNTRMPGIAWIPSMQSALSKAANSKRLTLRKGSGKVPLMLTEFGYFVSGANKITPSLRAKWWPIALTYAAKYSVVGFNIYQFWANPSNGPNVWDTSILTTSLGPTKTYVAIWKWANGHGLAVTRYTKA